MTRKYNRYSIKSHIPEPRIKPLRPNLEFTPSNKPIVGNGRRCNQQSKLHLEPEIKSASVEGEGVITNSKISQSANTKNVISHIKNIKNQEKSGDGKPTFTPKEQEVSDLIFKKGKSVKQVAEKYNCGVSNIYNILYSIKEKQGEGVISQRGAFSDPSPKKQSERQGGSNTQQTFIQEKIENKQERQKNEPLNGNRGFRYWRLHGVHLHVRFNRLDIEGDYSYYKKKLGTHKFKTEGVTHTITAYPLTGYGTGKMEIYIKGDFRKDTREETLTYGYACIKAITERIEWDYHVHFNSKWKENVTVAHAHLSEVNNEIATEYLKEGRKLKVVGLDGKVWLEVDFSLEHPEVDIKGTGKTVDVDSHRVSDAFNDYRDPTTLLPRQLQQNVELMAGTMQTAIDSIAKFTNQKEPEYKKTARDDKESMFR